MFCITIQTRLIKYHIKGNRKDIIVQVSPEGKQVYQEYVDNVAKNVFRKFFEVGKEIPDSEIKKFAEMMSSLKQIKIEKKNPVILEEI